MECLSASSSIQEFRRMSFSGYVLNGEQDNFFYVSLSRLHPQRIHTTRRASESVSVPPRAPVQEVMQEKEKEAPPTAAESEVRNVPSFHLLFSSTELNSCFFKNKFTVLGQNEMGKSERLEPAWFVPMWLHFHHSQNCTKPKCCNKKNKW